MTLLNFTYIFEFEDKSKKQFDIQIDLNSMEIVRPQTAQAPDWTRLEHAQCSNCPLKKEKVSHCPVALNLSDLVPAFGDRLSHEKTKVTVRADERFFGKNTDLQTGLQSIYGLIMATSGCPHFNFLKPMARFHLPFSTFDETIVRTLSIYYLRQHYFESKGLKPDYSLKDLEKKYGEVNKVNAGISHRIKSLKIKDSSQNGIIILDSLATMVPWELSSGLSKLDTLFQIHDSHSVEE